MGEMFFLHFFDKNKITCYNEYINAKKRKSNFTVYTSELRIV